MAKNPITRVLVPFGDPRSAASLAGAASSLIPVPGLGGAISTLTGRFDKYSPLGISNRGATVDFPVEVTQEYVPPPAPVPAAGPPLASSPSPVFPPMAAGRPAQGGFQINQGFSPAVILWR